MIPTRFNHAGRSFLHFGSFGVSCHRCGSGGVHILSLSIFYPGLLLAAMLAGLLVTLLLYIEMMRYSGTGSANLEVGNNMFVQPFASV